MEAELYMACEDEEDFYESPVKLIKVSSHFLITNSLYRIYTIVFMYTRPGEPGIVVEVSLLASCEIGVLSRNVFL